MNHPPLVLHLWSLGQARIAAELAPPGIDCSQPGKQPLSPQSSRALKLLDGVQEILTKSFTFVVAGWERRHLIDFFRGWEFYFPSPARAGCTFDDLTSHLEDFIPDVALGDGVRRDSQLRRDWISPRGRPRPRPSRMLGSAIVNEARDGTIHSLAQLNLHLPIGHLGCHLP